MLPNPIGDLKQPHSVLPGARAGHALTGWSAGPRPSYAERRKASDNGSVQGHLPIIGDAHSALMAEGAAFARMSGSGATCFGIRKKGMADVMANVLEVLVATRGVFHLPC